MLKFAKFAKLVPAVIAAAVLAVAATSPARALTPISSPDAAYLGSTTLIDISGIPIGSSVGSVTDGTQTVTFSSTMTKYQVGSGWATWGAPPHTEGSTPPVLFSNGRTSLTMLLSSATTIFGFEAEPNPFSTHTFSADFYSGMTLLGTVSRPINGNAGARLLAASDGTAFDKIVVSSSADFAIGQLRYGSAATTPEPGTMALLGTGVLPLLRKLRRRRDEEQVA